MTPAADRAREDAVESPAAPDDKKPSRGADTHLAWQTFERAERTLFEHYRLTADVRHMTGGEWGHRVLASGEGPPLVLVGGGTAPAAVWASLMSELPHFRALAAERPGWDPRRPVDYENIGLRQHAVSFFESLLDGLELEKATIVAHSIGGLWAIWYAIDRPDRVSALVQLGCPAFLAGTRRPLARSRGLPDAVGGPDLLSRLVLSKQAVTAELRGMIAAAWALPSYRSTMLSLLSRLERLADTDALDLGAADLARVRAPVLLLWGDRDVFGRLATGTWAAEMLPTATLDVLRAGHLPWLDQPAACAASLSAFLEPSLPGSSFAATEEVRPG
jgi:pimeloyl-ACP methyl ester carboxylesterase